MKAAISLDTLKDIAGSENMDDPVTSAKAIAPTAVKRQRVPVLSHPAGFKQLSVKVDTPVYDKLKGAAHHTKQSHQDIMYAALEEWLQRNGY